jgi:hypothetical protein
MCEALALDEALQKTLEAGHLPGVQRLGRWWRVHRNAKDWKDVPTLELAAVWLMEQLDPKLSSV